MLNDVYCNWLGHLYTEMPKLSKLLSILQQCLICTIICITYTFIVHPIRPSIRMRLGTNGVITRNSLVRQTPEIAQQILTPSTNHLTLLGIFSTHQYIHSSSRPYFEHYMIKRCARPQILLNLTRYNFT